MEGDSVGVSAVSAPVSPHNAARSSLFRLIAPSTVDLPYRGQWLPPLDGATERVLLASDKLTAAEQRYLNRAYRTLRNNTGL